MKTNVKRILGIFLTIFMVVGMLPMSVSAGAVTPAELSTSPDYLKLSNDVELLYNGISDGDYLCFTLAQDIAGSIANGPGIVIKKQYDADGNAMTGYAIHNMIDAGTSNTGNSSRTVNDVAISKLPAELVTYIPTRDYTIHQAQFTNGYTANVAKTKVQAAVPASAHMLRHGAYLAAQMNDNSNLVGWVGGQQQNPFHAAVSDGPADYQIAVYKPETGTIAEDIYDGNNTHVYASVFPEFYVHKDYFKSEKINTLSAGSNVKTLIKGILSLDEMIALNYTAAEIEAVGYTVDKSVTGVTLDQSEMEIAPGATKNLTAAVTPSYAENKAVAWSSSDESVATVADGVVTGVSAGTATITVETAEGGFTDTCVVTVKTTPVTGVELDEETLEFYLGGTGTLVAAVSPANASNQNVTWYSSDESVATVADGVVTGVSAGTATITVETVDGGFTDTCEVTVVKVSPQSVVLDTNAISLFKD